MLDMDLERALYAEHFEQSYMVDPPSGQLPSDRQHIEDAEANHNTAPSTDEANETVPR